MYEHLMAHKNSDYIFIYRIKTKNYKDFGEVREYRPEQHQMRNGRLFAGSDAKLFRIKIPTAAEYYSNKTKTKYLRRRKCKTVRKEYDASEGITKSLIHRIRFLQRHERRCKANAKKKVVADGEDEEMESDGVEDGGEEVVDGLLGGGVGGEVGGGESALLEADDIDGEAAYSSSSDSE